MMTLREPTSSWFKVMRIFRNSVVSSLFIHHIHILKTKTTIAWTYTNTPHTSYVWIPMNFSLVPWFLVCKWCFAQGIIFPMMTDRNQTLTDFGIVACGPVKRRPLSRNFNIQRNIGQYPRPDFARILINFDPEDRHMLFKVFLEKKQIIRMICSECPLFIM